MTSVDHVWKKCAPRHGSIKWTAVTLCHMTLCPGLRPAVDLLVWKAAEREWLATWRGQFLHPMTLRIKGLDARVSLQPKLLAQGVLKDQKREDCQEDIR